MNAAEDGTISLIGLTVDECEEMYYGRVPNRVRDMCKCAFDWDLQDQLQANAAKPIRDAHGRKVKSA